MSTTAQEYHRARRSVRRRIRRGVRRLTLRQSDSKTTPRSTGYSAGTSFADAIERMARASAASRAITDADKTRHNEAAYMPSCREHPDDD